MAAPPAEVYQMVLCVLMSTCLTHIKCIIQLSKRRTSPSFSIGFKSEHVSGRLKTVAWPVLHEIVLLP